MSLAKASAFYVAPIPLRLILAVTFLWAGMGKLVATMPVQGEDAALLANMGVQLPAPAPTAEPASTKSTEGEPAGEPDTAENGTPPADPAATPPGDEPTGTPDPPADPTPPPPETPGTQLPETQPPETETPEPQTPKPGTLAHAAEDYPDPVEVKRLHGLALLTYNSAHPRPNEDGTPGKPIWPDWAARDHWPVTLAWAAAITEVAAAVLILVGLLTRLSALAIAFVMLSAAWLTQIGPAIQSGDTLLGFLPNHDLWDTAAWNTLLWQVALVGAAFSLLLAGPGCLSLDRAIGSKPRRDDFDDEDDDED